MPIGKRLGAEFLGTLVLVLSGCGAALTAMSSASAGSGHLVAAAAFGLTLAAMAYALGHISGAHFNPAVTLGLYVSRRFPRRDVAPYMLAQVAGAIVGAGALFLIASGKAGFSASHGFASNGFGDLSPGGYSLGAALLSEVLLTFVLVLVIAATGERRSLVATAPLAAGIALTLVHLIGSPIDGGSFNPARSVATALIAGGRPLGHLWLFILAPLIGGSLAGVVLPLISRSTAQEPEQG